MAFGESLEETAHDEMIMRLNPWIRNPPDYSDVHETYKRRGRLLATKAKLLREISYTEDKIALEADRPRSNETKVLKLEATKALKDRLAELESEIAIVDNDVKLLEYRLNMYKVANYQLKNVMDL